MDRMIKGCTRTEFAGREDRNPVGEKECSFKWLSRISGNAIPQGETGWDLGHWKVVDDNFDDNPADIERNAAVLNYRLRLTDFLQTSILRHDTIRSGTCSSRTSNPPVAGSNPAGRAAIFSIY